MAHTGAARAAVEALTQELARDWAADGVGGHRRRARPPRHRVAAQVPGGAVAPRRRDRSAPAPRARWRSTAGWWRCWPRRWAASLSGSVITLDGALDNWTGPWPPQDLVRDGEVPTEDRVPASPGAPDARRLRRRRRLRRPRRPRPRLTPAPALPWHRPRGRSVVVAQKPSKLLGRVRFPSPAWPAPGAAGIASIRAGARAPITSGAGDSAASGTRLSSARPRGVAQSGSAPGWGPGGRRFKSCLPDVRTTGGRRLLPPRMVVKKAGIATQSSPKDRRPRPLREHVSLTARTVMVAR